MQMQMKEQQQVHNSQNEVRKKWAGQMQRQHVVEHLMLTHQACLPPC